MNNNQIELSLREVLKVVESLKQYSIGADLPDAEFLLIYSAEKVIYVIEGMEVDLERLIQIMVDLKVQQRKTGLMEYFEERIGIEMLIKLFRDLEKVVSRILKMPHICQQLYPSHNTKLIDNLATVSNRLLRANEQIITYKHRLDIAIVYHEICYNIISSLNQEICDCLEIFDKLLKLKLSSPRRHLKQLELDQIVARMKINDLSYTNNMSMKSMKLPTFNAQDEQIYTEYSDLESRIGPLSISLDIVPMKIEEFNMICSDEFSYAKESIREKYGVVLTQWSLLQRRLERLKKETIDRKWNDIFTYLIKEISATCEEVLETYAVIGITDEVGEKLRLCSNSVTLINKAFQDNIIYENEVLELYNSELLPVWEKVSNLLTTSKTSSEIQNRTETHEHVSFKLPKALLESEPRSGFGKGLGIDLGIGVENIHVPYSIEKKDKIKLFRNSQLVHEKKDIKQKLLSCPEEHRDDDEVTLVNKTPKLSLEGLSLKEHKVESYRNIHELWHMLTRENSLIPSRIPLIVSDYLVRKLPIIKKKLFKNFPPSKIPEISPDHPVFNSPDRILERKGAHYRKAIA